MYWLTLCFRTLAEGASKIPQRDAFVLVSKSFHLSPTALTDMPDARVNVYRLLIFGTTMVAGYRLKSKQKPVVGQWLEDQYMLSGERLKGVDFVPPLS